MGYSPLPRHPRQEGCRSLITVKESLKSMSSGRIAAYVILALALTCQGGQAVAGVIRHTVEFNVRDLVTGKVGEYDRVTLPGCELTDELGRPQLPLLPVTLAVPAGARVLGVGVESAESTELLGTFYPRPAQPPRILPIPGVDLPARPAAGPDPSVYESRGPYPATIAELTSEGRLAGSGAVGVSVYPVQYIPDRGKLRFFTRIVLTLEYEEPDEVKLLDERPALAAVASVVLADGAEGRPPPLRSALRESHIDQDDYEYVVITNSYLRPAFVPLAAWKTKKGIPANVVLIDWIDSTYTGRDTPERVRNFVRDAYENWGTTWILLGGDTGFVPARHAYAMTSEAGTMPDEDDIPCDLYFADLDGTWDADGDNVFGELADSVDLYPDVFVGRASFGNVAHAEAFVSKLLSYERSPAPGYHLDMLMAGEILWSDPYTDSGVGLNMIDRESVPPRYDPITKLYESLGNESPAGVVGAIDDGQCHVLHDGHAWYNCMGCGTGMIYRSDVDGLTNGNELPVLYTIGCWPGAIDYDCIGERFLENPSGGAVAFIGNSRYGWGSPGNPGYGYSDRFMAGFYDMIFVEAVPHIGPALAASKAELIPLSQSENVYRWHQYEVNLLGDPEMLIWTDHPAAMTVTHPESIVAGSSLCDVAVWTAQGPAADALVCLSNGTDVYKRGLTGPDGTVSLTVNTSVPDSIDVTVTAANCHPYEAKVPVSVTGQYLRASGYAIADSVGGNGDGLAGPGESIELALTLRNFGTEGATDVQATLSTDDPWVHVVAAGSAFGEIEPGATVAGSPAISIDVEEGCANGHVALVDVSITSNGGRLMWHDAVALTISAPVVSMTSYDVDDAAGGDGDGIPEPNELVRIMIELTNSGLASASRPHVDLWTSDPYLVVTDGTADLPTIAVGGSDRAVFSLSVDSASPSPHFPVLYLESTTDNGIAASDTLVIPIASTGLADHFESGAPGWEHGGAGDLWLLTDHRSNSGATSWYCGSEGAWQYPDGVDCHLDSPEFVLGIDAILSFSCWYEVAIYGVDGLYVEVLSGGVPVDTLDFIGSGGALPTLGEIGNDWLEYRYALSGQAGDTVRVRFRFVSDASETAEGVYIDDVSVSTAVAPDGTGVPDDDSGEATTAYLYQNCPNPFSPSTSIRFYTDRPARLNLSIYNIQGRLIRTLVDGVEGAGDHVAFWDGKDEIGVDVAAGVYMYRLTFEGFEDKRKMILVR